MTRFWIRINAITNYTYFYIFIRDLQEFLKHTATNITA